MPLIKEYNRNAAIDYALTWANSRNPKYYDFESIGGDCTNFISQCLFAGSKIMNYTPITGWFYSDINHRSAAWTSVHYLHRFLTHNKTLGVYASEVPLLGIKPGDIIQLGKNGQGFYHSLFVTSTGKIPTLSNTLICTHSIDSINRPLDTYQFDTYRCLHINGVFH